MSSDELAICVQDVSKRYEIYATPRDRLKQFLVPRLQSALGLKPGRFFREFWALKGVSFDVRRGETVGIVGRNGAGKSTLLQAVCGTLAPTSGVIEVRGRVAALLELGAGFDPESTGRENVYVNGGLLGLSRKEVDDRFDEIAAFADIGDFIDQPVKTYSSGMQVRLAFAVSASLSPDVLIVDEALAVGDFVFTLKCMKRIEQLKAEGCSILFVSHDVALVQKLCDRVLYLKGGEAEVFGPAGEVTSRYVGDQSSSGVTPASIAVRNADGVRQMIGWPSATSQSTFQSAIRGNRTGSGQARVVYADVSHETEGAASMLGDAVRLDVYVEFAVEVTDFCLSFYLIDEAGQLLMGTSTQIEGVAYPEMSAGEHLKVSFSFENRMREGGYGITLIASRFLSESSFEYLDYIEPALHFRTLTAPGKTRWAMFSPRVAVSSERIEQLSEPS